MIFLADTFFTSSLKDVVKILLTIDAFLYDLIAVCLRFIIDVSSTDFKLTDIVDQLTDRIYIVIGVFALFLVSYSLIKALFDPNNLTKGKVSAVNIIKNVVISIVLVTIMPTIFDYMYRLQNIIIENNVIGSIILGNNSQKMIFTRTGNSGTSETYEVSQQDVGYNNYVKIIANDISFSALNAFLYSDDEDKDISEEITAAGVTGSVVSPLTIVTGGGAISALDDWIRNSNNSSAGFKTFRDYRSKIIFSGSFSDINLFSYSITNDNGTIHYKYIFSTIAGFIVLGLVIITCVDIVIRTLKLILMQLISPIAVFARIIPNSKIFENWMKETLTTYLELFIRLALFNLIILIFASAKVVLNNFKDAGSSYFLFNIFFIIGLFAFIVKAPKLITDILGIKKSEKSMFKRLTSGALSLAGGLAGATLGVSRALSDQTEGLSKGRKWANAAKYGAFGGNKGFQTGKSAKNPIDLFENVSNNATKYDKKRKYANQKWLQAGGNASGFMASLRDDVKSFITGHDLGYNKSVFDKQEEKAKKVNDSFKKIESLAKEKDRAYQIADAKVSNIEKDRIGSKSSFLNSQRAKVTSDIESIDKKYSLLPSEQAYYSSLLEKSNSGTISDVERSELAALKTKSTMSATDAATRSKLIKYSDDLRNNTVVQNDAWANYNNGVEGDLKDAKVERKAALYNFANSGFQDSTSQVYKYLEEANGIITNEQALNNPFASAMHAIDPSSTPDVMKAFSDMVDDSFGTKTLMPTETTAVSKSYADSYGDVDKINAISTNKAVFDSTAGKYIIGIDTSPYFNAFLGVNGVSSSTSSTGVKCINTGAHQYDANTLYTVGSELEEFITSNTPISASSQNIINEIRAVSGNISLDDLCTQFNNSLRVSNGRDGKTGNDEIVKKTPKYGQAVADENSKINEEK